MLTSFHKICDHLGIPLAKEKTVWPCIRIVFLGLMLDSEQLVIALPVDKIEKAVHLIRIFIDKKKATVQSIQQLTGLLNFLNRAIYPGRAFMRRMYCKLEAKCTKLKPHHHVSLDAEFHGDCHMWLAFLMGDTSAYCRPFIDLTGISTAEELMFFTDSSANELLGFGGILGQEHWFFGQWETSFI